MKAWSGKSRGDYFFFFFSFLLFRGGSGSICSLSPAELKQRLCVVSGGVRTAGAHYAGAAGAAFAAAVSAWEERGKKTRCTA